MDELNAQIHLLQQQVLKEQTFGACGQNAQQVHDQMQNSLRSEVANAQTQNADLEKQLATKSAEAGGQSQGPMGSHIRANLGWRWIQWQSEPRLQKHVAQHAQTKLSK